MQKEQVSFLSAFKEKITLLGLVRGRLMTGKKVKSIYGDRRDPRDFAAYPISDVAEY